MRLFLRPVVSCLIFGLPLGTALVLTSPQVFASPAEEAEAKKHFEIGLTLYKNKVYDAALIEFTMSYTLNPRPSALRNAAQCNRDLGRYALAYDGFAKLLKTHGSTLPPRDRAAVVKAVDDLGKLSVPVEIKIEEPGAKVEVDGRELGTTPFAEAVRVDVGPRKFKITKVGFDSVEKSLTVLGSSSPVLEVTLIKEVKTGTLKVSAKIESGAKHEKLHVYIDDVDKGDPPISVELSPGSHIVELRGDKTSSAKKTVEILLREVTNVSLEATTKKGKLRIEVRAEDSRKIGSISVDGDDVGKHTWEGDLPVGSHEVTVTESGYEKYTHLIAVGEGTTVIEAVTLVKVGKDKTNPFPYRGLYGRFGFMGAFSLTGTGGSVSPTVACGTALSSCDYNNPIGIAARLDVGYSFDWLSVEGVAAFMTDYRADKLTIRGTTADSLFSISKPGNTALIVEQNFRYLGLAGYVGVGGRITSKDEAVRFTLGLSLGGAYRTITLKRTTGANNDADGWVPGFAGAFAPAMMFDAGMLFGSTPGTRFSIGIAGWLEFQGDIVSKASDTNPRPFGQIVGGSGGTPVTGTAPSPAQTFLSGTQFYLGPTLGFQFGR